MQLELKNLHFSYEPDLPLLAGISYQFAAGSTYALMGPSGRGKSTLARLLAGHLLPKEGTITLDGELRSGAGREILLVGQEDDLLPWFGIGEQLCLLTHADRAQVEAQLQALGLSDCYERYPHELSVGMKKRAALARCLLARPKVLILDETLASLALEQRQVVTKVLDDFARLRKCIVLVITHQREEAQFFAVGLEVTSKEFRVI